MPPAEAPMPTMAEGARVRSGAGVGGDEREATLDTDFTGVFVRLFRGIEPSA
jgi:hypothetical protein